MSQRHARKKEPTIRISGIVIPAVWSGNGEVVEVAIATRDEEEYLIEDTEQIGKFTPFLRQEIAVEGILKTRHGKKFIQVLRFGKKR